MDTPQTPPTSGMPGVTQTPPPPMPQAPAPAKSSSVGQMIGAIIIIAVVAIGGLYYWGMRLNEQVMEPPVTSTDNTTPTPNSSDDPNAIENDLDATAIESIDADFGSPDSIFGE